MYIKIILAFMIALALTLIIYPFAIPFLQKIHFGQSIREDGPQSHQKKAGTPTMGGVVFIVSSVLATLMVDFEAFKDIDFIVVVLAFVGYGLIGFIDDYLIVVKKNNDGLSPKAKFLMQSVLAIVFYLLYMKVSDTCLSIPFIQVKPNVGAFYLVIVFFLFTGCTNGVNLSDGLDGLCAGLVILALIPYVYFCYRSSEYDIIILVSSVIGSLIGYLRFNLHPAKIFMGDSGSLALGGLLASIAMVTKEEIALIFIGGVFVAEVMSDIIQIGSYKLTGKRVFKMAPLHHHFELSGWSETKVVNTFWTAGLILSILGIVMAQYM